MASKPAPKKKPVSKVQATAVVNMLKSQKGNANGSGSKNSGPAQPTPANNPVSDDDDEANEE